MQKTIGQCKDCKWYHPWEGFLTAKKKTYGECYQEKTGLGETVENFGCWFWKEKKCKKTV